MPPTLADLAAHLDDALGAEPFAREGDPNGVWLASARPVRRLGLLLEAGRAPYPWAGAPPDALLVHRPFGLWPARLPPGVGVLAYHAALDAALWHGRPGGLGPALFGPLDLTPEGEPFFRDGALIGALGVLSDALSAEAFQALAEGSTGVPEAWTPPVEGGGLGRVAVVGAMTDALVREAGARGAGLYVTGQVRKPALQAVRETGIGVLALGQAGAERWGLGWLGGLLQARWPGLEVSALDTFNAEASTPRSPASGEGSEASGEGAQAAGGGSTPSA